ncbi:very short patch repair endonuclease [Chloroflexota bacterium]
MDTLTPEKRSWNMSRIHSTNTKPEMLLRSVLHRIGFRFRIHRRDLPGKPDIILPKYHTVIFVHGCFWHQHPGCIEARQPKTNEKYWTVKLENNVKRDRKNRRALRKDGWRVLRFWECEIERGPTHIASLIARELREVTQDSTRYTLPIRIELIKAAKFRAGYNKKR